MQRMTRAAVSVFVMVFGAGSLHGQTPAAAPAFPATADSLFFAGRYAQAKAAYDTFLAAHPAATGARLHAGYNALRLRQPDDAIAYFNPIVTQAQNGRAPVALAGLAMAYALKGDRAVALDHLERAAAAGFINVAALDQDPAFARVRSDPRFVAVREQVNARQFPCTGNEKARAFDFWIGEWDAYNAATGVLAGHSIIQRASGGCMILENWTSNVLPWGGPYEGKSMNFLMSDSTWKQVWIGSQGDLQEFGAGVYRDGAMRFTYQRPATPQGPASSGNFIFYNLGPNKVRQYQDVSTDGGQTSQVVYDFIYVRKGSGGGEHPR